MIPIHTYKEFINKIHIDEKNNIKVLKVNIKSHEIVINPHTGFIMRTGKYLHFKKVIMINNINDNKKTLYKLYLNYITSNLWRDE